MCFLTCSSRQVYGILVKLAGSEIKVGAFGWGHFKNAENRNFSGAPWRITVEKVAPPGEWKLHKWRPLVNDKIVLGSD